MPQTKQSAAATYKEAMSELMDAVNALDQAHGMLKEIGWDRYISTKVSGMAYRHVTLLDAVAIADKLLYDMQHTTCPDCGRPLDGNDDCLSGDCPEVQ